MLIELPVFWIIVLNCVGWPLIQLGLAWLFTRLPVDWFHPVGFGTGKYESWMLEQVFRIKFWKDKLPDAAGWFGGGFAKRRLAGKDADYLRRFIQETWRGELCHWSALAFVPVFFLWNPWWADVVIVVYALMANLPCILAQRYNRIRLRRVLLGAHRNSTGARNSFRRH
jgi:glycosyl-4,4'-diaponeurosporenoate acyltransferase